MMRKQKTMLTPIAVDSSIEINFHDQSTQTPPPQNSDNCYFPSLTPKAKNYILNISENQIKKKHYRNLTPILPSLYHKAAILPQKPPYRARKKTTSYISPEYCDTIMLFRKLCKQKRVNLEYSQSCANDKF
ncbi:unnamed protein product [Blepharisma stoltei]|uniref:Uncharacterized protein n=1 Tax=Blepharisma stoltei TaxID=1481888 RepID=A0AAU9K3M8_9CILI|nr:unnamed protein product [Blepharisma stoltei]